jgi:phospholipid/cholesterol/gamma-HCH transport system substrate-binding protein
MKSFSERNTVRVAVVGLVAMVGVGALIFYSNSLPFLNSSTDYSATFTDASGLRADDDVRVSGVRVGSVDSISLDRTHVRVRFHVSGVWLGDETVAAIKIKTLLGQEYVALDPRGTRRQDPASTIPATRTTTPVDVSEALSKLAVTTDDIDTAQLADSFETLAKAFADTPAAVRTSLQGLTALSQTIASRDSKLRELAGRSNSLTSLLVEDRTQVESLITDGSKLLDELQARSSAITALLTGTESFATELTGLVHDNSSSLRPALDELSKVTTVLSANRTNIDKALRLIGPYYSLLTDATGNGHWMDIYLCGLFDSSDAPELNATALRNCTPAGAK